MNLHTILAQKPLISLAAWDVVHGWNTQIRLAYACATCLFDLR
jgi:hypothetical protein